MKDGVAVEQGSHDELMDHKGIFTYSTWSEVVETNATF